MFNVPPPSNIYSEDPTQDITFGIDNPTYVALATISAPPQECETFETVADANVEESGNHYEVIDVSDNISTVETKDVTNEDKLPLANISHEELQEIDVAASENISVDDGQTSGGNIVTNETLDIFDDILNKPDTEKEKQDRNLDEFNIFDENLNHNNDLLNVETCEEDGNMETSCDPIVTEEEEKSENLLDF